jgi:hypothetical protein
MRTIDKLPTADLQERVALLTSEIARMANDGRTKRPAIVDLVMTKVAYQDEIARRAQRREVGQMQAQR